MKILGTTRATIHCGFALHQSKSINQTVGFLRNNATFLGLPLAIKDCSSETTTKS